MAPARVYPTVPEQVLAGLLACRDRGLAFDQAWLETIGDRRRSGVVRFPHLTKERRGWRDALAATRAEWQAAYNGEPTEVSDVVLRIGRLLAEGDDASVAAVGSDVGVVRTAFVLPPGSISHHPRYVRKDAA